MFCLHYHFIIVNHFVGRYHIAVYACRCQHTHKSNNNMIPKIMHQPKSKELTCKQQKARLQVQNIKNMKSHKISK